MRKVNAIDWQTGKVTHENVTFHQFGLDIVEYERTAASSRFDLLSVAHMAAVGGRR